MMGEGLILPEKSISKKVLSGNEMELKIVSISPEDGNNVIVKYPDGYEHHHQATGILTLLEKVANVLRTIYNVEKFEFDIVPEFKADEIIKIKGISYDA